MRKTVPINLSKVVQNGTLVHNWLGSLWTQLFQDREFLRANNQAQGLLSAQLYLNFTETLNLLNRKEAPVFHRERWRMLTLKRSEQNTGKAVAAQLGGRYTPKIGAQNEAPFDLGSKVEVGGYTAVAGVTTYPLRDDVVDVVNTIADNIVTPSHVLVRGVDFYVEAGTLVFLGDNDPFTRGFPVRSVGDDEEVAIWVSDALIDKDFVFDFAGHVLGLRDVSSEFYAGYLNALWDMYNKGVPLAVFRSGIAAMLGEPFILEAQETVEDIVSGYEGIQVITDAHVYVVSSNSTLRSSVAVGNTLTWGELLTETIRVYDNLDPTRLSGDSEYGPRARTDIDALFLPAGFFRTQMRHGLGLTWEIVPITLQGYDANGNPKLQFTVYGSDEDVNNFWEDFWAYCEDNGISCTSCFSGYLRDTLLPVNNAVWGSLSPLEYFLYNFLKANLLIVAVDSDKLSVQGRQAMHLLSMLRDVIPAHVCLFVLERRTIPTDEYDMDERVVDNVLPIYSRAFYETAGVDEYEKVRLTYGDARPIVRLIPKCQGVTNEANEAT
jgi:hypothetical protein